MTPSVSIFVSLIHSKERNQRGSAICGSKTTMPNGFYSNQKGSNGGVSFAVLIDPDEIPP